MRSAVDLDRQRVRGLGQIRFGTRRQRRKPTGYRCRWNDMLHREARRLREQQLWLRWSAVAALRQKRTAFERLPVLLARLGIVHRVVGLHTRGRRWRFRSSNDRATKMSNGLFEYFPPSRLFEAPDRRAVVAAKPPFCSLALVAGVEREFLSALRAVFSDGVLLSAGCAGARLTAESVLLFADC